MAPYPENDKTPKAPDKAAEKSKVGAGRTLDTRVQPTTAKNSDENDSNVRITSIEFT